MRSPLCLRPFSFPTSPYLFRRRSFSTSVCLPRGQFGCPGLFVPSDFQKLSTAALTRSEALSREIYACPPGRRLLALVDELSDVLCQVVDVAEVCRHIHPDEEWVEAAQACHDLLCNHLEQLNCDDNAHESIQRLTEPAIFNALSIEEKRVTQQMLIEMQLRGVGLDNKGREEVLSLQATIRDSSDAFNKIVHAHGAALGDFVAIPSQYDAELRSVCGLREPLKGRVPNDKDLIDHILRTARSEDLRRTLYLGSLDSKALKVRHNLGNLYQLLDARHKLAKAIGFPTFAHLSLQANMARTPDQVENFLEPLALRLKPKLRQELAVLAAAKSALKNNISATVNLWDSAYLIDVVKRENFARAYDLSPYLSIGNVLRGLQILFLKVFSCSVEVSTLDPAENWCPTAEMYKLTVRDTQSNDIQGIIYLDLWERPHKLSGAATFILKAGCRNHVDSLPSASYRTPECVISCSFTGMTSLHIEELETLFHEMGHAAHTVLARTEYQHLSGTRGPELDFVEIPSTLMEYFVWDYRVLSTFAVHSVTGKVIPEEVVAVLKASRSQFAATNTMTSAIWALLDQKLHSSPLNHPGDVHAAIVDKHSGMPSVPTTHLYTQFSHLTHYGGGYYCYLLSRVYASQIWHTRFANDPFSNASGKAWREQVLRYGGAREAKQLLTAFLGTDEPSIEFLIRDIEGSAK